MLVLGIETATPVCAAAWFDGQLLGEIRYKQAARHAELLAGMVDVLLRDTRGSFDSLSGIAVSIGPGSFTGLRIGLALAKGIALPRGIPVVGVPTPDCIASILPVVDASIIITLPSRKGEIFAARYLAGGEAYQRQGEIESVLLSDFQSWAGEIACVAGPGCKHLQQAGLQEFRFVPEASTQISALGVARLGRERLLLDNKGDDIEQLEPLYLKPVYAKIPASPVR